MRSCKAAVNNAFAHVYCRDSATAGALISVDGALSPGAPRRYYADLVIGALQDVAFQALSRVGHRHHNAIFR